MLTLTPPASHTPTGLTDAVDRAIPIDRAAEPRSMWQTHRATVARLVRYAAVSVVATGVSMVTLGLMVGVLGLAAVWSNVTATAIGTVPSFELNRRWVWASTSRRSLIGQVVPFCALSFTGLVVSTVAVGVVAGHTAHWSRLSHTVAVEGANLAAYGTLWIVQYVLLDRVLFAHRSAPVHGRAVPEAAGHDTDATREVHR